MDNNQLFTVTVFTENQAGLLNQISIVFYRRGLNIESLSVSPSSIKDVHKFTITCWSNRPMMERVVKQIEKRVDVLRSFLYTDDEIIYQEVALYKVPVAPMLDGGAVERIIRRHNARILDFTQQYVIVEKTGHPDETESLFEELKAYGILQFVRSGRVAVTKSNEELLTRYLDEQERRRVFEQGKEDNKWC
ncbi:MULTISPECIES: acetolactate synthase small subunit [Muribaculum]|jgi:acetolactate synthase-1/3 small subunit|uniref:Acetolactate synthase small subunit n=1 Tax=Muribaculum caecicola TaxID=3038144 RepID=A0AC61S4I7_9BACT|nr:MULTISPECIES: acetolactate synthase small subunit [Muribaculum]THG47332.1 acetolactate synthase small subunit [Muribaculum caecicola]